MSEPSALRLVFVAAAIAHVFAAGVHVVALLRPDRDGSARHALFVFINLGVAIGFLWRPRWFRWVFGLLVVQQFASHGAEAIRAWSGERRVDLASLLVLAWMPTAFALLWLDQRQRPERSHRSGA